MSTLSDNAVVVGDTENYRQGDGYERTVIYSRWDPSNPRRLARAKIRVDRSPTLSYAFGYVWTDQGWQEVTSIGPEKFWNSMPGYMRGQTQHADRDMLNLADDLLDTIIEIGI